MATFHRYQTSYHQFGHIFTILIKFDWWSFLSFIPKTKTDRWLGDDVIRTLFNIKDREITLLIGSTLVWTQGSAVKISMKNTFFHRVWVSESWSRESHIFHLRKDVIVNNDALWKGDPKTKFLLLFLSAVCRPPFLPTIKNFPWLCPCPTSDVLPGANPLITVYQRVHITYIKTSVRYFQYSGTFKWT